MNLHPTSYSVTQSDREKINGHKAIVIWFTGLSGSGKTSISQECERILFEKKIQCFPLDGDNIRTGINKDLSFTKEDRSENIRRIAEISKLLKQAGNVVLVSFISPFEKDRLLAKEIIGNESFIEVFVNTSIAECQKRDPKGLYKKVADGLIKNFTGIDSPYEVPINPNLNISTTDKTTKECAEEVIKTILPMITL